MKCPKCKRKLLPQLFTPTVYLRDISKEPVFSYSYNCECENTIILNEKQLKELEKDTQIRGLRNSTNPIDDCCNMDKETLGSLLTDIIGEIPREKRVYGCEEGTCCFRCIGKNQCTNWYIGV